MKNWKQKKEKIANYYEDLIENFGNDPRACDYGRPESQKKKFIILSDVINDQHQTLLDVGCGLADYAVFLKENYPHITYTGVDITPAFIDRTKIEKPDINVQYMDILSNDPGKFDIVTANGIFYLLDENAEDFMEQLIQRMFECCNKVTAFNSLSFWCEDQEKREFYADPLKIISFCKSITPWVTLRHDYHSRDFTIYMYQEQV